MLSRHSEHFVKQKLHCCDGTVIVLYVFLLNFIYDAGFIPVHVSDVQVCYQCV